MELVEFAAATAVVLLGSVLQAATGVGGGFIIVPLLAWIDLQLVPAPVILASLSLSTLMAMRERHAIDWRHLRATMLGILPGAALGALILATVSPERLGIVFGVVVLLAILITALGPRLTLNSVTAVGAGIIAGAMGASSGIGAAPLALVYQNQPGPQLRATLAAIYTLASLLMLAILFGFGRCGPQELLSGVLLMPGYIGGLLIAKRFTARLDRTGTRGAVLAISAAAALLLIVRSL